MQMCALSLSLCNIKTCWIIRTILTYASFSSLEYEAICLYQRNALTYCVGGGVPPTPLKTATSPCEGT